MLCYHATMKECDMYPFIKAYFQERGFEVKSEIADCDVLAAKDNIMVAVEMKLGLTMRLLSQGVNRQSVYDLVYLAIPKPTFKRQANRGYQDMLRVVRRLNLGLLYVNTKGKGLCSEAFPPAPFDMEASRRRAQKKRMAAMEDFKALSDDYNIGGSTGVTRITPYRENALLIALYLKRDGDCKPKTLRDLGCGDKTRAILYDNHYGWFDHKDRGLYGLSKKGKKAIGQYKHICDGLKKIMVTLDDEA